MPPAAKIDCSVILFDLKAPAEAKKTLIKICPSKTFTNGCKDLTKLILLNSDKTKNLCNARSGGYSHIRDVTASPTIYDTKLIVENLEKNDKKGEADWLEGLLVALNHLEEDFQNEKGAVTNQILFLTDLSTLIKCDQKKVIKLITKQINKLDAFVYVVGPPVVPLFQIKSPNDVKKWMKDLVVPKDEQNLLALKEIISETENTVVCDWKMGIHLFFSFKHWGGSQPWKQHLAIGTKINIPAHTVKILNDDGECRLQVQSRTNKQPIWVSADDETKEYAPDDVTSGIERHGVFVQMLDNKMFQVENPRSFDVLCFTDRVNVPESLLAGGGCYCVIPAEDNPESSKVLNDLIDCLAEQDKYIIARRVYNNNFVPTIVALIPKPHMVPKCFIFTALPFDDDLPGTVVETKPQKALKSEMSEEVTQFLDSISIESQENFEKFPLAVNMMRDINIQKIVNKAAEKLLERHLGLEDLDYDFLNPGKGSKMLEGLKSVWPERELRAHNEPNEEDSDEEYDLDF